MIFRQWELVLSGRKTQTRRIWHDTDYTWMCGMRAAAPFAPALYSQICMADGRNRYRVGQLLPIIPKRGKPMIWIKPNGEPAITSPIDPGMKELWLASNWKPARVEIAMLSRERLQAISEADAIAEGVNSIDEYRDLWESINGKSRLHRWSANPLVTVIGFGRAWVKVA